MSSGTAAILDQAKTGGGGGGGGGAARERRLWQQLLGGEGDGADLGHGDGHGGGDRAGGRLASHDEVPEHQAHRQGRHIASPPSYISSPCSIPSHARVLFSLFFFFFLMIVVVVVFCSHCCFQLHGFLGPLLSCICSGQFGGFPGGWFLGVLAEDEKISCLDA